MKTPESPGTPVYTWAFSVPDTAIDENGHVNNVRYVQWMQDLAVQHWGHVGGGEIDRRLGCTWVARSHKVEYLKPAFLGDSIEALTWIEKIGRVRCLRKYAFRREGEEKPLAQGETDWVFVDIERGLPHAIPEEVGQILPITPEPPL